MAFCRRTARAVSPNTLFLRSQLQARLASAVAATRPERQALQDFYKLRLADDQATVLSPFPDIAIPSGSLSVAQFVLDASKRHAMSSDVALVDSGDNVSLTYGDLWDMHDAFRRSLVGRGVDAHDTAVFYLHNCPEYAVCLYGCLAAGVRVSPCNHACSAEELAYQMQRTRPKIIVTYLEGFDAVTKALSATSLSGVEIVIADLSPETPLPRGNTSSWRTTTLADFLDAGERSRSMPIATPVLHCARHTAILPFSSGTTGAPKPIALSHRNLIANISQQTDTPRCDIFDHRTTTTAATAATADGDLPCREATIGVMPFFHIYGMVVTLGSALLHGGKVVTMRRFQPDDFLRCCERHRVTQLHFVPPLALFVAQDERVGEYDLSAVRSVFCGAAPMGEELARRASERLNGATVRQGYGMTETSPLCTASPLHATKDGSVGVPLPCTEMRVVDVESGCVLPAGEDGELRVRGPQVMQGYVEENGDIVAGVDEDGFLPTGDIGHYDEDGYFFIVDRLKEIMKVKGFQVAPAELEAVLLQHAGIDDVGVTAVPHERCGEAPLAYVVRAAGVGSALTATEVQNYLASRLAKHKHLVGGVRFVDSIPKTMSGKILRRQLKAQALADQ